MIRLFGLALFLLTVGIPVLSAGESKLTVSGSATMVPLLEVVAKAYRAEHPECTIVIGAGGSSAGVTRAGAGEVSIGMCSRELRPEEIERYPDLQRHVIAVDAMVLVVNVTNPLTDVTGQQIRDIYCGKSANWKELGGEAMAIVPIGRNEGHGTLDVFCLHFSIESRTQGEGIQRTMVHRPAKGNEWGTAPVTLTANDAEALAKVITKPGAITYASLGNAQKIITKGAPLRILTLDGHSPSVEGARTGAYPLSRPLTLVTRGKPQGEVESFITFLLAASGQAVVADLDFITVSK